MKILWTWKRAFAVLTLLAVSRLGNGLECFVCSYAPYGNSSRLDACTDEGFLPLSVDARTCDQGCESVAVFNANGELESFHRNCAHNSRPLPVGCLTVNNLLVTRRICVCDWDLCNSSAKNQPLSVVLLIFTSAAAVVSYLQPKHFKPP